MGNFFRKMPLVTIHDLSDIFSYLFLSGCNILWRCFNCFNSVALPQIGSLNWGTVSHKENLGQCIPENNLFGEYYHTYQISWLISILHQSYHTSYIWYTFFFVTLSQLSWFFCIHCKWLTFETDEKSSCSYVFCSLYT